MEMMNIINFSIIRIRLQKEYRFLYKVTNIWHHSIVPRSQLTVYLQVVSDVNFFKQLGSRSGQHFVGLDLGLNCLQRLSADDINRDGGLVVRLRTQDQGVQGSNPPWTVRFF